MLKIPFRINLDSEFARQSADKSGASDIHEHSSLSITSVNPSPSQGYPTSGLRFQRMGLLLLPRHRL
jgi:hypothetical protein